MMETGKDKYDYVIKADEDALQQTQSYRDWREETRIKENMRKDIEWLDKNKHLLYSKDYFQTRILISLCEWKYFTLLWKIIACAILFVLAHAWRGA